MKRTSVITFLFAFAISESIFGQIHLNFSGGINNSICKFENFEGISPKSRLGYFFGAAPGYQISEKVQFLIDFQYSQKGYQTGYENNFAVSEWRFSYIDIIPEIEYKVLNYLAVGVGVNYGLKLTEEFKIGDMDWTDPGKYESIKSSDFGLTGKLKINHNNIFGFIRYNIGLKEIADVTFTDANGQAIGNAKQSNRNLQIGIGYTLNLKKK